MVKYDKTGQSLIVHSAYLATLTDRQMKIVRETPAVERCSAVQNQKAVTAYLKSKQLLPFGLALLCSGRCQEVQRGVEMRARDGFE